MKWRGFDPDYTVSDEALHDTLTLYLALRKERQIGMLWAESGHFYLAPMDCDRRDAAEPIPRGKLAALVLAAALLRKPARREAGAKESECAA